MDNPLVSLDEQLKSRPIDEFTADFAIQKGIENVVIFCHPFYNWLYSGTFSEFSSSTQELIDFWVKKGGEGRRKQYEEECRLNDQSMEAVFKRYLLVHAFGGNKLHPCKQSILTRYFFENLRDNTALIYLPSADKNISINEFSDMMNLVIKNKENTFHAPLSQSKSELICGRRAFYHMDETLDKIVDKRPLNFYLAGANLNQCLVSAASFFFMAYKFLRLNILSNLTAASERDMSVTPKDNDLLQKLLDEEYLAFARDFDKHYSSNFDEVYMKNEKRTVNSFMKMREIRIDGSKCDKSEYASPQNIMVVNDNRFVDEMDNLLYVDKLKELEKKEAS